MNSKHNKFPKNILLIGSGGRESALGWKIANSPSFINNNCKLISAPGNPGLSKYSDCININVEDLNSIIKFVSANKIEIRICK